MKNISAKFSCFLVALFLIGCEDYLEVNPDFGISEQEVFSDYEAARGYFDNVYDLLLDIHGWRSQNLQRTSVNGLSDEAGTLFTGPLNQVLNTGSWIDRSHAGELGWAGVVNGDRGNVITNSFFSLRIVNRVINRIDDIPNMTETERNQLLGQAYFMRAWNYFQVIKRYGGMPNLNTVFSVNDDLDLPRLTYAESNDLIQADLEQAIALLPGNWDDANFGRANKGAALALKEMTLLYAASPLMQNDLESVRKLPYSQEGVERAAEAANDVIQYINQGAGGSGVRLMSGEEYEFIFYSEGIQVSPESLWYNYDGNKRGTERGLRSHYLPQYFSSGTGNDATAFSNPTQNIVDMFQVLNNGQAYDIDDPRSGYDPQNPYANRDPRFYNNVIVPGEQWGVDRSGSPHYQELYVGGRDYRATTNSRHTRDRQLSGYMAKKFIWPEARFRSNQGGQYGLYNLNHIFIRVSQIYLDYAEAMNEAYGPNSDPRSYGLTAVEAINIIRNRVNMPDVKSEYTSSKEVFRDRIRRERAIELFWENHRWHDLRRWMIADEVLAEPIRGVRAIPPAGHQGVNDKSTLDFEYNYVELNTEVRVFDMRSYWYPVPQPDVLNLTNFKQNPGW